MEKDEFRKLKFSERIEICKGNPCDASWQVQRVAGAYAITCRNCGTNLQSGCVPKCMKDVEVAHHNNL